MKTNPGLFLVTSIGECIKAGFFNIIKKRLLPMFLSVAISSTIQNATAQETHPLATDTLAAQIRKMQTDIDELKSLKISGFIQTQYQHAQAEGAESVVGGNFPSKSDSRFSVRRARLKTSYNSKNSEYVLQIDATERGVSLRDAYYKVKMPSAQYLSLTTGIFKRPFSYEVLESSSLRESPERTRVIQMLFPAERDLGAMLTFQPTKQSNWNFLKIEAGLFNGTGGNAGEFDSFKDFIGNIGIIKSTNDGKMKYAFRISLHNGGFSNPTKYVYEMGKLPNRTKAFVVDSAESNLASKSRQSIISLDTQISYNFPIGTTTIKAEYLQGTQPASGTNSTRTPSSVPVLDTYIRNFNGAYISLIQKIANSRHQLMVKYDWYDPNTNVSGNQIGVPGTALTKTDVYYSNLGLGWIYDIDKNIRLTAYYDMPVNETSSNLSSHAKDLKDNVFTFRMQYKF